MSSGTFTDSKYESAAGDIYNCRVQPETLAATLGGTANAAPAGAATQKVSARSSGSKRAYGMTMRSVVLRFTGAAPDGYSGDDISIPILTPDLYNSLTAKTTTGTYLGADVIVQAKSGEQER